MLQRNNEFHRSFSGMAERQSTDRADRAARTERAFLHEDRKSLDRSADNLEDPRAAVENAKLKRERTDD